MAKNLPANAGNAGSIPMLERWPAEGNGNPLQYSCLENPMDRRAWWATVYGVAKSQIRLSAHTHTHNTKYPVICILFSNLPLIKDLSSF